MKKKEERVRVSSPADELRKHSPIKHGLKIKDEDKPLEKYTKILPRLYLGNYQGAKDADFFKSKKIKAVLNCSHDIKNTFETDSKSKSVEYMRLHIEDSLKEHDINKMVLYFPIAVEFINKHLNIDKQNLFVHCYAGRQRSAACVAAYLICKQKMNPSEACQFILSKRKEAFHFGLSLNFEKSLIKYYKSLQKCN